MKINWSIIAGLPLILTILNCGGAGGGGSAGRFMLVVEGGSRLTKVSIPDNTRTSLTDELDSPSHFRISPDGVYFLASIGGILRRGVTSTGVSSPIPGYKFGDWNSDGSRIIAVSDSNVITPLNSTGSSAFEPIFNGNFGGGISSIDVNGEMIVMSYIPSGWSRITTLPLSGGTPTFLTPNGASFSNPRWSPNATKIVCESSVPDSDIHIMSADGTGFTDLATTTSFESDPVFLDNSTVLYTFIGVGSSSVYSVPATGGSSSAYYSVSGFPGIRDVQP
jgi:hypothetical protein